VVLKLSSLRRLWKIVLDLTSNTNLIGTFVIIKVLFIEEKQKMCIINVMCGLAYFCKLRRISDKFVKAPPPFSSQGLVVVDI